MKSTTARAATDTAQTISETRTGAAYEQCKEAYFTCMDQFCKLKNDDYRRCSCSDKVFGLTDKKTVIQDASDQLTVFTENLDSVGMTAAQATAMKTASEGENALTADTSASKALLTAIMNSIRGGDTNVGGKYSSLNSINISFDTANAFGMTDSGQIIAAYNGKNLYTAVYPQCRNAVRADCNDASLQRAVTAYLMAVEQDCNTVQTMITENQKKMTAAVREGGAMLDLARIENRQKHNSDDMTTCLGNVEKAVLSEEVCGANYHKCLDNGEFIDITTGAPIAGVVHFYKLEKLLTFNDASDVADQKLSKISNNRTFVKTFENRVKKFAEPALDRCTEKADQVWADYLDKAMLDIYYAQRSKVAEIKQGCFDFVSSCYVNGDNALTAAMKELVGEAAVALQPDRIKVNASVCTEYVDSCNNMFDGDIVRKYVEERQSTDTLSACRAVVKQCFDKYGGTSYENFYYPYSGLFATGKAADWFTLCDGDAEYETCTSYKSECAKQLDEIESCRDPEMMRKAFGGLDLIRVNIDSNTGARTYSATSTTTDYGVMKNDDTTGVSKFVYRGLRPTGVATEIYYQIIDILSTQCNNVQGRFVELQFLKKQMYHNENMCEATFDIAVPKPGEYNNLKALYGVGVNEDMCPRGYIDTVDTKSWGMCNCWENGARRSKWGQSVKCVPAIPTSTAKNDVDCFAGGIYTSGYASTIPTATTNTANWCFQTAASSRISPVLNQVCPPRTTAIDTTEKKRCFWPGGTLDIEKIPEGLW